MQVINTHAIGISTIFGERRDTAFFVGIFIVFAALYRRATGKTLFAVACFYHRLAGYAKTVGLAIGLLLGGVLLSIGACRADKLAMRDGYIILALSWGLALIVDFILGIVGSMLHPYRLPERREIQIPRTPGDHFKAALAAEYRKDHP